MNGRIDFGVQKGVQPDEPLDALQLSEEGFTLLYGRLAVSGERLADLDFGARLENQAEAHARVPSCLAFRSCRVTPVSAGLARWWARRARNSVRWALVGWRELSAAALALAIKASPNSRFSAGLRWMSSSASCARMAEW